MAFQPTTSAKFRRFLLQISAADLVETFVLRCAGEMTPGLSAISTAKDIKDTRNDIANIGLVSVSRADHSEV